MLHLPTHQEALGWRKFLHPSMLLAGVGGAPGTPPPPPAGFQPTDVFGLELWLRGDNYVAGTWTDTSGKARHATQATAVQQPAAVAALREFNNQPVLAFDAGDNLDTAAWGVTIAQPMSSFVIARKRVFDTVEQAFVDGISGGAGRQLLASVNTSNLNVYMYAGTVSASVAATPFKPNIYSLLYSGANSDAKVNGAATAVSAGTNSVDRLRFGDGSGGTSKLDGYFADYFLYSVSLAAYDRYKLENLYAAARYAVPTTFDPLSVTRVYATWSTTDKHSDLSLTNNNLTVQDTGNTVANPALRATQGKSSGKHYWEYTIASITTGAALGIGSATQNLVAGNALVNLEGLRVIHSPNGNSYKPATTYGAAIIAGDVLGCALDMDAGTFTTYKNGVSQGVLVSGLTGTIYPYIAIYNTTELVTANFGGSAFRYPVPSGFNAGLYNTNANLLTAWWKADSLALADGANVTSWSDSSGLARTLTNSGTAPTFVAKGRNAMPGVRFAAANGFMQTTTGLGLSTGTWFVVASTTQAGSTWSAAYGALAFMGGSLGNVAGIACTSGSANVTSDYDAGIAGRINIDGVVTQAFLPNNDARIMSVYPNAVSALTTSQIIVGNDRNSASRTWPGIIHEVLVFADILSTSQIQQITGYLSNKWSVNASIRPFDPLSISGCKAWYRVDGGCDVNTDATGIGTVYDRSSQGNNLIQATAGQKPLYKTSILNSKAIMRFDGTDDNLLVTFAAALSQPYTVYAVVKPDAAPGVGASRQIIDGASSPNRAVLNLTQSTGTYTTYAGTANINGFAYTINEWDIIDLVYNGASSTGAMEGITTFAGNPGANSMGGLRVGSIYDLSQAFYSGDIAELIVYSGAHSAQDRATIRAYLSYYYDTGYYKPDHAAVSSNVKLWIDATQEAASYATGAALPSITDRSSGGIAFAQATGSKQPTLQYAQANGHPIIRFDGTDDGLSAPDNNNLDLTGDQTFLVVLKTSQSASASILNHYTGAGSDGWSLNTNTATANQMAYYSSGGGVYTAGGQTINDGAFHVDTMTRVSNTILFYKDGVAGSGAGGHSNVVGATDPIWFGSGPSNNQFLNGDVAELIACNAGLSGPKLRSITNYLAQKYNIAA